MAGATLTETRRQGETLRMNQGDLVCVSAADEADDIVERMEYFRIPRVLVSAPDGLMGIIELEELLQREGDPVSRRMGDLVREGY